MADPPADDPETSPTGGLRRKSQELLGGAKDLGVSAADRIRTTDTGAKALDSIQDIGQRSVDTVRRATGAVDREVGRRTDNLALGPYREELDAALAELVAVVIAQDAEIRALRDRLDQLDPTEDRT
jgi:hypothetical protein